MMCWNYDKTPWEEFPDMSISLLSASSTSKEFTLKIPPQVNLSPFPNKLSNCFLSSWYRGFFS